MGWTLGQLAAHVGGVVAGDERRLVRGVRTLETAEADDLSFVARPRHAAAARGSRAGALLVGRDVGDLAFDRIVVGDVMVALAELLALFHPRPSPAPGIHPTAALAADCAVDPSATIGPYAVVGSAARIGPRAVIGAHVVVGERCEIGEAAELHPHVVLYADVRIGARTTVHAGSVLGADGFGYVETAAGRRKIPQVGGVEIGDEVEIGALAAVDRATLDQTVVGSGTKIDNLVQVGHNVRIGRDAVLCGQSGVGGSSSLGDGVVLAGQSGVIDHLELGAGARVAAKSAVLTSLAPGTVVAGVPAIPIAEWRRQQSLLRRLARIWKRLRSVEIGGAGGEANEGGGE